MAKSVKKKKKVKVEATGPSPHPLIFQQHHHFVDQQYRSSDFLVKRRKDGIPWLQEEHALRCAVCC
jgi:hypothetical protein